MKITRTITKARYAVKVYDKNTKQMHDKDFVDTDNINPDFLEKSMMRKLEKHERLVDFEQVERLSFKLVMEMTWDGEVPEVKVESIEPIETEDYAE